MAENCANDTEDAVFITYYAYYVHTKGFVKNHFQIRKPLKALLRAVVEEVGFEPTNS